MTTSNIEQFDEITGQLLGKLYENFPVPCRLLIKDFVADGYAMNEHLGVEVPNDKGDFFLSSVDWLANAGYLQFHEKIHNFGYQGAVLTAKGLETLKATPESLQSGQTLGEKLVDASKGGAKEVMRGLVGEILSLGTRIASGHFGLPS